MAEYIDRKQICYTWWLNQDGTFSDGVTLQSVIDDMPTADVVPVVRCKDCKHYKKINYDDVKPNTCEITTRRQQPYDFCSYGERKNDDG